MTFGQRIRKRRSELGLTQEDLAKSLGVSPQHISAIEQDKRAPGIYTLAKIANSLGTTTDYLLTGNEVALIDSIPVIKADKNLALKAKKALIALVEELHKKSD